MPKTKISDYSSTASNNTDVDGINIAEGMAPSNVNNAMREIMAHLKDWQAGNVAQDMKVDGAFTCTGATVLSSTLSVGSNATVSGGMTCTGAAVLSSSLTVGGAATITGNLAANGTSSLGATTFSGAVIMSSNVTVDGNATLNGNITAGSNTSDTVTLNALLSAGGGTGTSGQFLKSRGTSDTPVWDRPVTIDTAQTASGASVDFTDIPSGVSRVTLMMSGWSSSATANITLQIGTSSGLETTGYASSWYGHVAGTFVRSTTDALIVSANDSAAINTHCIQLSRVTGNTWVINGFGHNTSANGASFFVSSKTLSGELKRLTVKPASGTFDAGTINLMYE